MKKSNKQVFNKGQGIVEYILITALVALATIAMFKQFRSDISEAYRKAGSALVQGVDQSLAAPTNE